MKNQVMWGQSVTKTITVALNPQLQGMNTNNF